MTRITLKTLHRELHRLDPILRPESSTYKTALFMLGALQVGANVRRVARFTGLPRSFIAERARRLRTNRLWVGGKVEAHDWFKKAGSIAFWLDVNIAEGILLRETELA